MVARWRDGFDVVYAQRRSRQGETLPKRIVSAAGYRIIGRIADVEIPPNTGDFRLMSRRVVRHVVAMNETTDSYAGWSPSSASPRRRFSTIAIRGRVERGSTTASSARS